VDAVDPRWLALPPQQDEQPAIAEPPTLIGELAQPSPELRIRRLARAIADHCPIRSNDRAGPPLRQAQLGLQVRDPGALGDGPYHFFDNSCPECRRIEHLLGQQFLQLRILPLKRFQPLGLGDVHPAVFGLPVVKRRFADPMLPRQIGRLGSGLVLLQHRNNLFFRKTCSLHSSVLRQADSNSFWRKFSVAGQRRLHVFATGGTKAIAAVCLRS